MSVNARCFAKIFFVLFAVFIFLGSTTNQAEAVVEYKVGNFTKATATGSTSVISGLGFQPKAVILFTTTQTATGSLSGSNGVGIGFAASSTQERSVSIFSVAAGTSDTARVSSEDGAITILSSVSAVGGRASLTSFDSGGFTLTWDVANTSAYIVHYIAIGGDDITNATSGSFTLTAVTGDQAVTGLGFRPDFVMFLTAATATSNSITPQGVLSLGLAASSTSEVAQGGWGIITRDALGTSDTCSSQRVATTVIAIVGPAASTCPATDALVGLSSFDTDGFTLSKNDAINTAAQVHYLALKGGQHDVGAFANPGAVGTSAVTNVDFQPKAFLHTSWDQASGTAAAASAFFGLGAVDNASTGRAIAFADIDADAAPDPDVRTLTTDPKKTYTGFTGNGTLGLEADLVSFDTNGFTLDWSTVVSARQHLYWAVADTPAPASVLDQKHFRWYENLDSATPTTALAVLNATTTGVDADVPIRLRFNVGVTSASLGAGQGFKLQFSTTTTGGWADVGGTASSTIWRGYDNTTPLDGSNLPSNLVASSTVAESYEEQNVATGTPSSIAIDGFGEWDWVIQNNNASTGATYYFRKVKVTGSTPLNTYTRYPSLTTAGNVTSTLAGNQIFYKGQTPAQAISTITLTATGTDAITAYGDIRVKIASSSVNMQWDTADTLATLAGTASSKASTAVSYPDVYTLLVDVTSDFTATETLEISGLSYTSFGTSSAATSSLRLFRGGPNDGTSDATPTSTVTIKGALTLANHPNGQEPDALATSTSVTNAELLAFQLTPDGESASTTLVISVSSQIGINDSDVTGIEIIRDDNKDGAIGGGETTAFFGAGTISGGNITFNTTSSVPVGTSTTFIMRADIANLDGGDTMTLDLLNSNISALGTTTALSLGASPDSRSGSITARTHSEDAISRTLRSVRWHNDDGSVSTSTAAAASETAIGTRIGQRQQARFQVDNTGGPEGAGIVYRLQFATGTGGPWTDVGSATEISWSQGLAGANGDSITTSTATTTPCGGCTFVNGTWHENQATSSGNVTLVGARFTEFGYMVKTDRALAGTNYYLRLMNHASSTALDSTPTSSLALLTTTSTANDIRRFSKEAVTATPAATSQLAYFFDQVDYDNSVSDDTVYTTITSPAATHSAMMRFSRRAATTSDQIDVDWNGKSSVAPSTAAVFLDVYRFGATNAWVNQASDNTTAANTEFTLSGSISTNLSEYYEADGSNFWTHWRVRQASSSATLSTDRPSINFLGVVTLTSATSQTFVIDDAATSIASTTVSDSPSTARFTAANDIRVRIPAGLNLEWDASTTVATLGGSAASKASTTVSYENSNKTLVINVITNFAAGDTLEFSGLKYRNFTAASASSSRTLRADGASDTTDDSTDNRTLTIRGKLDAANHDISQEDNKFIDVGSVADAELFAFRLTRTGEDINMATITIDISATAGIASGEVTDVNLIADLDADGVIDAGEPSVATGSVSISGNSGTITFSSTWTATATRNYIVRADVASIEPGDHMRLELSASKINARGATSQVTVPVGGSISLAGVHSRPSKAGGGGAAEGGPPAVTPLGGATAGGGGAGEGGPPPGGGTGGGGAGGGGEGAP